MWVLLENTTFPLYKIVRIVGIIRVAGIIQVRKYGKCLLKWASVV